MASLAQVTRETRIIGKFGAIALVAIIFLFFSFKGVVFIYNVLNPPEVIPPDMKFGDIVNTLPVQSVKPTFEYQINTVTGALPVYPSRLRVYKLLKPEPDLLALQKARDIVQSQGYNLQSEQVLDQNSYLWTNTSGGSIEYNTLYKNFKFKTGISLEQQGYRFRKESSIIEQTLSYINVMGASTNGIDQSNYTIEYYRSDGANLNQESDISVAYLAKLDLFQNPVRVDPFTLKITTRESKRVDVLPIYYEDLEESNQSFLIKAGSREQQYVSGSYSLFRVDPTEFGMYPLKTSIQAFEDLKNGNAYIQSTSTDSIMSITELALGYFIPKEHTEYILPIYIFKGKDFTAYVNAIGKFNPTTN